ncbi:MAG: polysaccharide deacetylase family protein [Deltaproteobacteria bacterium]|nr:polysaccharide deacetylase family protein [Deltaproteobacteria bacterium]
MEPARGADERLCAVSVDLDEIHLYRALHGLPPRGRGELVYRTALPRLGELASSAGVPLTLFAVGEDVEAGGEARRRLGELCRAGHVVENHSFSHRYDLARLDRAAIDAEIAPAQRAVEAVTGRAPQGFRAPGYGASDALLDALEGLGLRYDSSVFPCPAYYLAKALAVAAVRARGGHSVAVPGKARGLLAPACPYRPARPWYRAGGAGLIELPIQVAGRLRLPVIGTSLVVAGPTGARWLVRQCRPGWLVNLELHGLDFLDRSDGLEELAPYQPDVRIPLARKLASLRAALAELGTAGYRFVTLPEAAARAAAMLAPA